MLHDAFKIRSVLRGRFMILFLMNDGAAYFSLIAKIEMPTI